MTGAKRCSAIPTCATGCARAYAHTEGRVLVFTWDAVKVARADAHPEWLGRTVDDLAREWGG